MRFGLVAQFRHLSRFIDLGLVSGGGAGFRSTLVFNERVRCDEENMPFASRAPGDSKGAPTVPSCDEKPNLEYHLPI